MDRTDSGFHESCRLKAPEKESPTVHRSNTAPTRQRKSRQTATHLTSDSQHVNMEPKRPASEKRSNGRQRSEEARRQSIASSSENSTRSRRPGYGSKPSSRRTSCTFVDPSRPARHYRIKSSQTVPTTNRDIDDVLALHFRSCSLFQNSAYSTGLPSPSLSGHGSDHANIRSPLDRAISAPAPHTTANESNVITKVVLEEDEKNISNIGRADTTMHWISPDTRRREYEMIDRANSGIRGLVRRIMPRSISGPSPRFYEDDKSDMGSVRRYRMDVSDDEDVVEQEKDTSPLRHQSRKLELSKPRSTTMTTKAPKRWGCF